MSQEQSQILIIDDVSSNLLLIKSILEAEDYRVIACESGTEALEQLKQPNHIQLILLDIMMPDVDGYEFLDQKRELVGDEIPVIIVSAKTDSESIQKAIEKGAYDYLSKPFNMQDVLNKTRSALGG
jgi:CheY-like chemotaxis protein